jgi:hypothetical protein
MIQACYEVCQQQRLLLNQEPPPGKRTVSADAPPAAELQCAYLLRPATPPLASLSSPALANVYTQSSYALFPIARP